MRGKKLPFGKLVGATGRKFSADFMEEGRRQPPAQHRGLVESYSGKKKPGDFDRS